MKHCPYLCVMEVTLLQDEKYMKEALRLARQAYEEDEIPIGCVVVANGRILGKGYNQTEKLQDPTAHAEMIAITSACSALGGKYLTDCTLYVTIEPCLMCAGALAWAQVSRVVWGAGEEKSGFSRIGGSVLHPKTITRSGVLAEECRELMVSFFKNKR
jgi:tRNA(adenine34) deaminase